MKFKLKITKDILKRSSTCKGPASLTKCAFALAFNELIPNVVVTEVDTRFKNEERLIIAFTLNSLEQHSFIKQFDNSTPEQRINMPEQEFDVKIPDKVIEYYYGDTVKAIQHLIDNPVLTPII